MNNPHVMFVLNSLGAGGAERSTAVLLPHLVQRGYQPSVVILRGTEEGDEDRVRRTGVPVDVLRSSSTFGRVRELRHRIRTLHPAVVHTAIFDADVIGRLAAAHTGTPVLSSLINTPYEPLRLQDPNVRRLRLAGVRAIDRWTARHLTAHFHAISPGTAQAGIQTLGIDPGDITVVERGRDRDSLGDRSPERRARVREVLGIGPESPVIISVGRQEYQKGQGFLVRAVELLAPRYPNLVALVAGRRGNASAALKKMVEHSTAREQIRLLGHRNDVADLLACADVFAFPSLYEGLGGALVEAFGLGVPVVCSRMEGLRDIARDGETAIVVEPGRPAELAEGIARILDDRVLAYRLSSGGAAEFTRRFTMERYVEGMVAIYERVAGG